MRRSKKMFTRLTSMLHTAVEAFAPEMSLLEQFRYHWKCVTQFFLDTTDEKIAVENTTIPEHLEQMIEVLMIEEQENSTPNAGSSMEFTLQHKILETMQTLGKADCPPGMKKYVLVFFTKLLGKLKQNLLPHVSVHKPVNKLIRCCGHVKASPTEIEEVFFLLQVSSKLKQDSYLVNFFLEKPSSADSGSSPPLSPGGIGGDGEKPEYSLVDSLLSLVKSEDSRVAIKACEGLLLVTSILEDNAASTIVLYTAFCERMADQLSKLFKSLPQVLDPADVNQCSATWGFDQDDQMNNEFTGKRQLTAFLSWLDYVNQLSIEAHPMVSKALAQAIYERFILTAIEAGLFQTSEPCAITVTAILTKCLKIVSSPTLAQEFVSLLLGTDMQPEKQNCESPHKLRRLLIQRINHLSDQLSVETLRLFQALLKLSYQPILDTLVVRNFQERNYLDWNKVRKSRTSLSRTASMVSKGSLKTRTSLNSSIGSEKQDQPEENENQDQESEQTVNENLEQKLDCRNENDTTNKEENQNSKVITSEVKGIKNTDSKNIDIKDAENISDSVDKNIPQIEGDKQKLENTSSAKTDIVNEPPQNNVINRNVNADISEDVDDLDGGVITIEFSNNKNTKKEKKNGIAKREDNASLTGEGLQTVHSDISFANTPLTEQFTDDFGHIRKGFVKKKIEKSVNGFLLVLPDHLKTSESVGDTGYDSYLREAHKQCKERSIQEFQYDWPPHSCLDEEESDEDNEEEFYEGAFLNTVFKRLERMLDQSYDINLEVTGILALLCQFRHPYLHEFLIDTSGLVKDSVFTLHRILLKVCQDIKTRGLTNQQALQTVRKNLHEPTHHMVGIPDEMFFQGIIVLEEFCKELAAIAFESATMNFVDD